MTVNCVRFKQNSVVSTPENEWTMKFKYQGGKSLVEFTWTIPHWYSNQTWFCVPNCFHRIKIVNMTMCGFPKPFFLWDNAEWIHGFACRDQEHIISLASLADLDELLFLDLTKSRPACPRLDLPLSSARSPNPLPRTPWSPSDVPPSGRELHRTLLSELLSALERSETPKTALGRSQTSLEKLLSVLEHGLSRSRPLVPPDPRQAGQTGLAPENNMMSLQTQFRDGSKLGTSFTSARMHAGWSRVRLWRHLFRLHYQGFPTRTPLCR